MINDNPEERVIIRTIHEHANNSLKRKLFKIKGIDINRITFDKTEFQEMDEGQANETVVDVHQALYKIVSSTKTNSFLRTSICYEYFISLVPKLKRTKPNVRVTSSLLSG